MAKTKRETLPKTKKRNALVDEAVLEDGRLFFGHGDDRLEIADGVRRREHALQQRNVDPRQEQTQSHVTT